MSTTAVKERPILFTGPNVRAILDGRKTQTRRIVKPHPPWEEQPSPVNGDPSLWAGRYRAPAFSGDPDEPCDFSVEVAEARCPYGVPGERLWVQEKWRAHTDDGWTWADVNYEADDTVRRCEMPPEGERLCNWSWRPSIHMPRWASRITLEITGVRVERVADISEGDAIAEGVHRCAKDYSPSDDPDLTGWNVLEKFRELWHTIHKADGPNGWAANPFVWVIDFHP